MTHLIVEIGSKALSNYIRLDRVSKDTDYVMSWDTYRVWLHFMKSKYKIDACYPTSNGKKQIVKCNNNIYEIEIAWTGSSAEEILQISNLESLVQETFQEFEYVTAGLNLLYELKMSHRYLRNSPHFKKTMDDINLIKSRYPVSAVISHPEFYKRRESETYYYNHPSLNVTKDKFFKKETYNKYDHDWIHQVVKIGTVPAYSYILEDGQEVKCSKVKWDKLSNELKLHCALEECYVLTLERGLIPNEFKTDVYKTFKVSLMKLCTSVTSGWFREWCYNNYGLILSSYNDSFKDKFLKSLL